jgi:peptide/nickel transport system substrate-binding protein
MRRLFGALATVGLLLSGMTALQPALAQKSGGILRVPHFDSPASLSLHEESTVAANRPGMGIFNNLVLFKQDDPKNSMEAILPELATGWSWNEDGTELTLPLRGGVKWHDGKPFTAADVKCTWDLLTGKSAEKLRINPRKPWYANLAEVTTNGDLEVTFHLNRPQASFLALLASGWSPVYPCHIAPAQMRTHPIGTGPFKFVEFKPNQSITVTRNRDYWKPDRPYVDGIEWDIIKDLSTRTLAFIASKGELLYGVTIPQLKDIASGAPRAICDLLIGNVRRDLLVNRDKPPFDNPELRHAMSLAIDHQAFIDILYQGEGMAGGAMLPRPDGLWGMPPEMLKTLPGYDPNVTKNRAEAKKIMESLGYGPDRHLTAPHDPSIDPQYLLLPRSGGDSDRPAAADLHRR